MRLQKAKKSVLCYMLEATRAERLRRDLIWKAVQRGAESQNISTLRELQDQGVAIC